MKSVSSKIDIVWFKRDLRLFDHQALQTAIKSSNTLLLVYLHEPLIWQDPHYDERHLNFIKESLQDLNKELRPFNTSMLSVTSETIPFLEALGGLYQINNIYASQETGLQVTFERDLRVAEFCAQHDITFREFQNNGVVRGLKNRDTWKKLWYAYMNTAIDQITLEHATFISTDKMQFLKSKFSVLPLQTPKHLFQRGGRVRALDWMVSFFEERIAHYSDFISKPEMARFGCSRLSPYLAWGNLSIREVYQRAVMLKKNTPYRKQCNAFLSRLRWQSHFIQKFEMEPRMEYEAVNKGFLSLEHPSNDHFIKAWKFGYTGYPLVDASMRCVANTGYINFRMRSMVVSFLTHHLFQHFSTGGAWLAKLFLDFEPGIHYGQMQMQAGLTGINTVRVYNPVKNAIDHDSKALFITKYVPELAQLPTHLAIEPWKITALEEQLYGFTYGIDYPKKIVEIVDTRKHALNKLYGQRKNDLAIKEKQRILERHTMRRA